MVISDIKYIEVDSNTDVKGGAASASAFAFGNAFGNNNSNSFTSASFFTEAADEFNFSGSAASASGSST